jgi:hypothetical protein
VNFHDQPVLAAAAWPSNAEMIEDVVRLGYIRPHDQLVDLTWGRGVWWKNYHHDPERFWMIANDPKVVPPPEAGHVFRHHDFHAAPFDGGFADVVAYDPPYVSKGGRSTSTIPDFNDRYGLSEAESSPRSLHEYNLGGLREAVRISRPGGIILVKCMDYISSGDLQMATIWMHDDARAMKLKVVDRLIHVGDAGPQPKTNLDGTTRRQVHARSNHSTLWVFAKPGRRRK